jgi:hypothetical protein
MELQPFNHTVRNPSGIKNIFAMTVLCSLFLISELRAKENNTALHVLGAAVFCLGAAVLLWSLYRAMKKPIDLCLQNETISLNGRTISAEQIKVMMIRRDSVHPIIGIKPHGTRIVPTTLCFRYVDKEEKGIADIAEWAKRNNVKIDYSFFFRWI